MRPTLIAAVLMACTSALLAQEKPDPAQVAKRVAPYVSDDTVLIAHVDLSRLDADDAANWFIAQAKAAKLPADDVTALTAQVDMVKEPAKKWLTSFRAAGGREAYYLLSLGDLPASKGFILVPVEAGADAKALRALLMAGRAQGREDEPQADVTAELNNLIYFGDRRTLDRLKQLKPADRAPLIAALAGVGDAPVAVALAPTPDTRRVVRELMPTLPDAMGGDSTDPLSQGLQWLAIGITPPPQPAVRLTIQATNADAATALEPVLQKALASLKQLPPLAPVKALLDKLQVERRDAQLHVAIDPKLLEAFVGGQVLPLLMESRATAVRVASAANLRQLGQAILLYCNAHKQMPPDLQTAAKDQSVAPQVLKNPARPQWDMGYVFIPPPDASSPPDMVIAHERYEQWGDGINALFGDGHVEWVADEQQFKKALDKTRQYNQKRQQELDQKK